MSLKVDIKKNFGNFTLQTEFETDGGVLGILGASGCGKSMTLKCIAGVEKPDEGYIELNGTVFFDSEKKINLKPQLRHVGLLFQNYALFPNMTVFQNLMTGACSCEKDKRKASRAVEEMLGKVYLQGVENDKPSQLSGGQQQRVALARILLSKPDILMLDEPFSALDGYLRWNLELELSDVLKEFEGNILFVSHSRDEIYRICDKVCVMEQGKSTPVIPVKQLFAFPETKAAALLSGCKNFSEVEIKEGKMYAKDWGIFLESIGQVPFDLKHVGIRSHYIHLIRPSDAPYQKNVFPCIVERVIEDVFSMVLMIDPLEHQKLSEINQADAVMKYHPLRMELSKEEWREYCRKEEMKNIIWIAINPKDVMLLR